MCMPIIYDTFINLLSSLLHFGYFIERLNKYKQNCNEECIGKTFRAIPWLLL